MTMTKVEIDVPEEIVPYTVPKDKDAQIIRNAMLVYPYIKSGRDAAAWLSYSEACV